MDERYENPAAEVLLEQAIAYFQDGRLSDSEKVLGEAIHDFPDFVPAYGTLGDVLLHKRQAGQALAPLRKAVSLAPHDGMAHFLLGVAFLKTGRFHFAHTEFLTAKSLVPESAQSEVLRHLGWATVLLGDAQQGLAILNESIRLDPACAFAYCDLAQSHLSLGNYDEAVRYFSLAHELEPEDEFVAMNVRAAKQFRKDFYQLPKKGQDKRLHEIRSPEYRKEMRIQMLFAGLEGSAATPEDLFEVTEELKKEGLGGQVAMFKDPASKEGRAALSYIKAHEKIKGQERKLSKTEVEKLRTTLFNNRTRRDVKQEALILLAHQGTARALRALEDFRVTTLFTKNTMALWAEMACNECASLLESNRSGAPSVRIHKLDG